MVHLNDIDFQPLEVFSAKITADKQLQLKFKSNPEQVADEQNVEIPEGYKFAYSEKPVDIEIRLGHLVLKK